MDVVVAVNDDAVLDRNLLRSPLVHEPGVRLHLQRGFSSAGAAYNPALAECTSDIVIFVHQDVYVPAGWIASVRRSVAYLAQVDPTWAVLGLYGITKARHLVGQVWSSGLNMMLGRSFDHPVLVDSVDELLLIVRRAAGLEFDRHLPGFHLYATDLVQIALNQGKGAYVICAPVVHNSRPVPYLDGSYFRSHSYLMTKWRDRLPIQNCTLTISSSRFSYLKVRARSAIKQLSLGNVQRADLDRNYDSIELAKQLGLE